MRLLLILSHLGASTSWARGRLAYLVLQSIVDSERRGRPRRAYEIR
jgi:hypothetical protein